MKKGKLPENILKRSVLKQITNIRQEVEKGAGVGCDCAFFAYDDTGVIACSSQAVTISGTDSVKYGIIAAVNNIAAGFGEPLGVLLAIVLPEGFSEEQLKEIMRNADGICAALGIQIMGGHTEVSDAVRRPVITVTAMGRQCPQMEGSMRKKGECQGLSVVMSKWIGMEGSVILAQKEEERLKKRFPSRMIEELIGMEQCLPVLREAATAIKSGVCMMHDARGGGVFGALWELSQSAGAGLEIDLKRIPVKQSTIELCEFLHKNPYELLSGGALLMCTSDPEGLIRNLEGEGISAAIIGRLTGSNDKIIRNDGEIRYLDPPRGDEISDMLS